MAASPTSARNWAVAPGEILAEVLEERGLSQSELARRMGRPTKTINEIVNAKAALTADTALQLELVLGVSATVWTNLEARYRQHLAEERVFAGFDKHESWLDAFPLRDLRRHKILDKGEPVGRQVAQLLSFFEVASLESWRQRWEGPLVDYRQSSAYEVSEHARAAWLRWGEKLASDLDVAPFDASRLRETAERLRDVTRVTPLQAAVETAQSELRHVGVAFIVLPEFDGTRVSGAARWLSPEAAVVQLSTRHKTDDHFWFSFWHEIGHLLDRPHHDFIDGADGPGDESPDVEAERRADRFARDTLIPEVAYHDFLAAGSLDADAVRAFARQLGIAPGIVVGRLQHDKHIKPSQLKPLKKPIRFA